MTDFEALLKSLASNAVEFILIGGMAAVAHGSSHVTVDLDVVYRRTSDNIDRLVAALSPSRPYLRGAPLGLPFSWDRRTIERGLNFTLTTSQGALDLLGEISGGGTYETLLPGSVELSLFGIACRCASLDQLIASKQAAGRAKDLEVIAELQGLREEIRRKRNDEAVD